MRLRPALMALAAVSLWPCACPAADLCERAPDRHGRCYWLSGLITMSADVGYVLAPRSGARTLQLNNATGGTDIVPATVTRALRRDALAQVRGEFRVCPVGNDARFDEKKVCVERARRVRVTYRNPQPIRK